MSQSNIVEFPIGVAANSEIRGSSAASEHKIDDNSVFALTLANRGIVSFRVRAETEVVGGAVTNSSGLNRWPHELILPRSPVRATKTQDETELLVVESGRDAALVTRVRLELLGASATGGAYIAPDSLTLFGRT